MIEGEAAAARASGSRFASVASAYSPVWGTSDRVVEAVAARAGCSLRAVADDGQFTDVPYRLSFAHLAQWFSFPYSISCAAVLVRISSRRSETSLFEQGFGLAAQYRGNGPGVAGAHALARVAPEKRSVHGLA